MIFTALLPLADAATGGNISEAISDPIGTVTGLFSIGDTPDHDPAKLRAWAQQVAATGAGICAEGKATRDVSAESLAPGDPGLRAGESIRFDLAEVVAAVNYAPEGNDGDPVAAASVRGLRTAIYQPMLNDGSKAVDVRPFLTSREAIARLAVGVAHGRLDCRVGWQEEPSVAHLRRIVRNYRNRPPEAKVPAPVQSVTNALEGTGVTPLQLGIAGLTVFAILKGL